MRDTHIAEAPITTAPNPGVADELAYRLRQQELTARYGHFALKTHDTAALLQEATRGCALGLNS